MTDKDSTVATNDDKPEYAERCRWCGSGEKSWHHDPPIGGSALDHKFTPSRSLMESLLGIGHGRPFHSVTINDVEYYALRSWAVQGLEAAAVAHDVMNCKRTGCDLCVMFSRMDEEEKARAEFESEQRDLAERYASHG